VGDSRCARGSGLFPAYKPFSVFLGFVDTHEHSWVENDRDLVIDAKAVAARATPELEGPVNPPLRAVLLGRYLASRASALVGMPLRIGGGQARSSSRCLEPITSVPSLLDD
jgi:hypothetical protein